MSQYVRQRVACWSQAGDFDCPLACLTVPDNCVPVGHCSAGTKIHVVRSFDRKSSGRLYVRRGWRAAWRSRGRFRTGFDRSFDGGVRPLLKISARRELLCTTTSHGSRNDRDSDNKSQIAVFPNHSCHARLLWDPRQPKPQPVRIIGEERPDPKVSKELGSSGFSTFGHHRGRGRNRVFAHRALTDGIFADGIFANRRGGDGNRLRPWEVCSNCCSHESQRSDTKDHEFQHRNLSHHCSGRLEVTWPA